MAAFPIVRETNNIINAMIYGDYNKSGIQYLKDIKKALIKVVQTIIYISEYLRIDLAKAFASKIDEDEQKLKKIFYSEGS